MAYKPSEMTASQIQTELGIDGRKLGQYLARIRPIKQRGKFQYYLLQDVIDQIYKKPGKVIPIDELKNSKKWKKYNSILFEKIKNIISI